MRGSPTPPETVAKFRKYYLKYGNASRAARSVGLPNSTGLDLARIADADEHFAELRQELYTREIAEVETLAADVARVSHRRFSTKWEAPILEGAIARDPRPEYGRLVTDSLKAMSGHRAKLRGDDNDSVQRVDVTISRYQEPEPQADDDGDPEA